MREGEQMRTKVRIKCAVAHDRTNGVVHVLKSSSGWAPCRRSSMRGHRQSRSQIRREPVDRVWTWHVVVEIHSVSLANEFQVSL